MDSTPDEETTLARELRPILEHLTAGVLLEFNGETDDLVAVQLSNPVFCQFCRAEGKQEVATFDFQTAMAGGMWAYGCSKHYERHRKYPTLGTGKGQALRYPQVSESVGANASASASANGEGGSDK